MKYLYITILFGLCFSGLTYAQEKEKKSVYFETDKSVLTDESKLILNELIDQLTDISFDSILISGHTDADGSLAHNQKLSERRAQFVSEYLISKGITKQNIQIEAFGEEKPVADNETISGRQKNRRVEIEITKNKVNTLSISDIFKKESQTFEINTNHFNVIRGEEGTEIIIQENAFKTEENQPVKGRVSIVLKEFYKKSDMILRGFIPCHPIQF